MKLMRFVDTILRINPGFVWIDENTKKLYAYKCRQFLN
jgi:hypothetical protein